jgi:hypothetical protein
LNRYDPKYESHEEKGKNGLEEFEDMTERKEKETIEKSSVSSVTEIAVVFGIVLEIDLSDAGLFLEYQSLVDPNLVDLLEDSLFGFVCEIGKYARKGMRRKDDEGTTRKKLTMLMKKKRMMLTKRRNKHGKAREEYNCYRHWRLCSRTALLKA